VKHYHDQNGCHNCEFVFCFYELDEERRYFCKHEAPQRPPCGSMAMREGILDILVGAPDVPCRAIAEFHRRWDEWSKGREVNPWGTCDHYLRNDL
jgi:hypothetical protein